MPDPDLVSRLVQHPKVTQWIDNVTITHYLCYLGSELSSAVKPAELTAPGGPELEAVAHHTVYGQAALQVTQPLGHVVRPGTLHHTGCKHLHAPKPNGYRGK